ncbi:MAG: sugar ABC transporter permease [Acholeplasmataceae bacterium]|nr:sugar ABC transporter permease [Acholeplasmataceae bacterium]
MKGRIIHTLKAIASGIIWGLGQLFNRQYLKAAFFFLIFGIFISIELGTSRYFSSFDPYSKIPGVDFSDALARKFVLEYQTDIEDPYSGVKRIKSFDDYYEEHRDGGFTIDELIEFTAQDIMAGSPIKYYVIAEELQATEKGKSRGSDLIPGEDDEVIDQLTGFTSYFTTYQDMDTLAEYSRVNQGTAMNPTYVFINIADENDVREKLTNYRILERKGNFYRINYDKFFIQVVDNNSEVVRYDNITNNNEKLYPDDPEGQNLSKLPRQNDAIFYSGDVVYGFFNPEGRDGKFRETPFSKYLSSFFISSNSIYQGQDQTDFAKFKLRVYFAMHPDLKADFEKRFDNFFYDRAGYFLKGIWSLLSLGTTESATYYQISKLDNAINLEDLRGEVLETVIVRGHQSSILMIQGLISLLLLMIFMIFWIWSIIDAYKTSLAYQKTHELVSDRSYFKKLWESSFEYIVLFPAFFALVFISVMPILYGFLVAFTSYSGQHADISLFDWVGFKNFLLIFQFGESVGIPFAEAFWGVLLWTIIWAIFSTLTVFFGGFFQAVIINSERVPLKKFWRTLFILPWAIPAIITQMVFANIFNDNGVVNHFLQDLGLYKILQDWGMLGMSFEEFQNGNLPRLFYLGHENIQWFGNPHNKWFVRITLIVVNIWLGFPFYMALMTSTMTGIDRTLYEAADIDGASRWQKFKNITFPLVMAATAPLLVMCFSGNFNNFGMIYFTTQGGANSDYSSAFAGDTDILISWMYTLTVDEKYFNMASVFSILIFLFVGSVAAWNYSRTKAFKED